MVIVCKFGGSSLATAEGINRVKRVAEENPERRFFVVSALGSAYSGQKKVTDLLMETFKGLGCGDKITVKIKRVKAVDKKKTVIRKRIITILTGKVKEEIKANSKPDTSNYQKKGIKGQNNCGLRISVEDINKDLKTITVNYPVAAYNEICVRYMKLAHCFGYYEMGALLYDCYKKLSVSEDYEFVCSRGEYLSGMLLSYCMELPFIDGGQIMAFKGRVWDAKGSIEKAEETLRDLDGAVIAGYYGNDENGKVRILTRGGTDVSGAVVAAAVNAGLYENYTDVDGFLTADPQLIERARLIDCLDYNSLTELSFYGAKVLHHQTVLPLRSRLIPCRILNTFNPESRGTVISHRALGADATGMTYKGGYSLLKIAHDTIFSASDYLAHFTLNYEKVILSANSLSLLMNPCEAQPTALLSDELNKHILRYEFIEDVGLVVIVFGKADLSAINKVISLFREPPYFFEYQNNILSVAAPTRMLEGLYSGIYDLIF